MAFFEIDFFSRFLNRNVHINAILPTDVQTQSVGYMRKPKSYQTLYLLHGIMGDCGDWMGGTQIRELADKNNIAVVMPSGENKFYIDNPVSEDFFGRFIGEELVDFTRATFPVSVEKKDTYIGGLSMGGYGALVNGLKYSDTFSCICAFSSALFLEDVEETAYDEMDISRIKRYFMQYAEMSGPIAGSDKDYHRLAKDCSLHPDRPKIFMTCGKQDPFLSANSRYSEYLDQIGYAHSFETWEGSHNWDFWRRSIERAVEWLPLNGNN